MKKESHERLEEIANKIKEKGFQFYDTVCVRGEPAKISCISASIRFLTVRCV